MGCGSSTSIYYEGSRNFNRTTWIKKLTKAESIKKYRDEGSIPPNCSDSLLECRVVLDQPLVLQRIGQYALKKECFALLMCWADILEYKYISEDAMEYQTSKGYHIYKKYLVDGGTVKTNVVMPATYQNDILNKLKQSESDSGTNATISKHLFDEFLLQVLQNIHDEIFSPFKTTEQYKVSIRAVQDVNKVTLDDFEYYDALGQGSFGFVVHCKKKSTGKHYAMKVQTKLGLLQNFDDCPERVIMERVAMAACQHPFIIGLDYALQTPCLAVMAMDLSTAGTLLDALKKCPNYRMPLDRVRFYAAEILLALAHIHRLGLMYRDLKPDNILLNDDGHIQLVDMGGIVDVSGKLTGVTDTQMGNLFEADYCLSFQNGKSTQKASYREAGILSSSSSFKHRPRNELDDTAALGETAGVLNNNKFMLPRGDSEKFSLVMMKSFKKAQSFKKYVGDSLSRSFVKTEKPRSVWPMADSSSTSRSNRDAPPSVHLHRALSIMGTNGYMAPEMVVMTDQVRVERKGYTAAVDYWGLGCVIFFLLNTKLPFTTDELNHIIETEHAASSENIHEPEAFTHLEEYKKLHNTLIENGHTSASTQDVIYGLLDPHEESRLGSGKGGVKKLKDHPFFHGINWSLLAQKHVVPPFLPSGFDPGSREPFESFSTMMEYIGLEEWMHLRVNREGNEYFKLWDFISPNILKLEMGLAEEIEISNATFKVKHEPKDGVSQHRQSVVSFSRLSKILSSAFISAGSSSNENSSKSLKSPKNTISKSFHSFHNSFFGSTQSGGNVNQSFNPSGSVDGTSSGVVQKTLDVIHSLELKVSMMDPGGETRQISGMDSVDQM